MHHLETNSILYDLQHGFRRKSVMRNSVSFIHELMSNHDKDIKSDIILMDFAKVFNKVPHKCLLYKLHWYSVRGSIYHWIQSFLNNHTQTVIIDGTLSSSMSITSDMPQVGMPQYENFYVICHGEICHMSQHKLHLL